MKLKVEKGMDVIWKLHNVTLFTQNQIKQVVAIICVPTFMFIDGRTKSYLLVIGEKANIVNVLNKIILYMYTSLHQCFSTVCNKLYGQPFGLSLLKQ